MSFDRNIVLLGIEAMNSKWNWFGIDSNKIQLSKCCLPSTFALLILNIECMSDTCITNFLRSWLLTLKSLFFELYYVELRNYAQQMWDESLLRRTVRIRLVESDQLGFGKVSTAINSSCIVWNEIGTRKTESIYDYQLLTILSTAKFQCSVFTHKLFRFYAFHAKSMGLTF